MKTNISIEELCSKKPSTLDNEFEFLTWFNLAESVESYTSLGFIDFMYKIMTQDICKIIGNPSKLVCCEIGFGAARLLIPASFIFKKAHGIDIHNEFDKVKERMKKFNLTNFELHKQENAYAEIPDSSLNFVYSFITFQHFINWDIADFYLNLLSTKMSPNGFGIIYFGENVLNDDDIRISTPENFDVFVTTLHVKRNYVKSQLEKYGFTIVECDSTTKNIWTKTPSLQFYVKFKK